MNSANNDILPNVGQEKIPVGGKSTLMRRIRRRMRRRRVDVALEDITVIEASGQFDKQWYLQHNPDVALSGMDPIQHYVRHGAAEGRDPVEGFSTTYYLRNNPDVAASGANPFRHYVAHGRGEGRTPRQQSAHQDHAAAKDDARIIAGSSLFDAGYYLKNNPDVAASGMNPLVHFCQYGFRELRNPSRHFDIGWYWLKHLPGDVDTNPLAHYLRNGLQDNLEIHPAGRLSEEDEQSLCDTAIRLLAPDQRTLPANVYQRAGIVLARQRRWADAEVAFSRVLALEWSNARIHARMAAVLAKQGKWWQAVESWSAATNLDPSRASWFFHLGEAQEKMNRFALAAEAYQRAIDLEPDHPVWYYLLGYMHERAGHQQSAAAAYAEAVARDPRKDVKAFGIGVFHQARSYWPEAAEAYARELKGKPASAELHFKLGMAHDRCYRWQEAEQAYSNAIALKPGKPYWHYRYGFVLERQQRFSEAAEAYAAAAMLSSKPMPYWWYRCGYVLAQSRRHKDACRAYLQTRDRQTLSGGKVEPLDHEQTDKEEQAWLGDYLDKFASEKLFSEAIARDATDAETHYLLGEVRERRRDWAGAAAAYADAVARSSRHRSTWYYRLGFVLYRAGRFGAACDAFRETRLFRLPYGVDTNAYAKNRAVLHNMQYREHVDVLPIRPCTVLYESTHGASVGGNPYAIFEYMVGHPNYGDWTHIWAVTPEAVIPEDIRSHPNVILAEIGSDLYRRYMATASHLINDSTFPYWFSRRPEQKYLNTWHGTPLKTLGKPIRADEEFLSHRNIQRNLLHATHVISPNEHTSDVLMDDFDVRGIFTGKLAETGYPRIDRTLNATPERIARVRSRLNLDPDRPIALYAPTWRGIFGRTEVDVERLRSDLERLVRVPCQWVFRGHPFSEAGLRNAGLPVAIAPPDIDTADVLAVADLLVTDYSSIFFDFLPTRRPVFYYCYDLEEYASSRGLYFDINEMPGPVCPDIESLVAAIQRWLAGGKYAEETYERAIHRFCTHEDGEATAKTVAFFMADDDTYVVSRYRDERPSLLFFGGHFAPNGINASFLNLMNALQESGKYRTTVAVEPLRIKGEPRWLEKFRQLPGGIGVLGRVGRIVQNAEQAWIASRFQQRREFASPAMRHEFGKAYRDEFRRAFGDARLHVLLDFDGYNPYWVTLFAMGGDLSSVCWLHNDFFEEFVLKHPYLKSLFAMYPNCGSLISVSERMAEVNKTKLAGRFHIPENKFKHCINVIDGQALDQLAEAPLDSDLLQWFEGDSATFLTMGRMSPEKDHAKLITAFASVVQHHSEAKLVILGEGVLRLRLERQIEELGLAASVYLAGQRSNPFPALRRCDCFVLSSNHEGQPMVLLEALALKRPVIATDIDGNCGVLRGIYGELVDNCAEGLARGMLRFLEGELDSRPFDASAYRAAALSQFEAILPPQGLEG